MADKLREERVRRVVEPLLSGTEARTFTGHDLEYVRDIGLVAQNRPVRIANPIYAEVVPRELTWVAQEEFEHDTAWYVDADGALNVRKLLAAFQTFFREHSEHWRQRFLYQEAWPQLLSAGVPAAGGEQRRAHRTGVRTRAGAHGPAAGVAADRRRSGRGRAARHRRRLPRRAPRGSTRR